MSKAKVKKTIITWAGDDVGKLQKIKGWLDETMSEIAEGKGAQIVSATTAGNTFAMQLTISQLDWLTLLGDVINHIENGTKPTTKTFGVIL